MKCVRQMTEDLYYIGVSDRRITMFENCFPLTDGVAYNSYLLVDEKTIVFDTVDYVVGRQYLDNIKGVLGDRKLDYLVVNHMEPDHCANITSLVQAYPELQIVGNKKTFDMIKQFYKEDMTDRAIIVKEGDKLSTGKHEFTFLFAPMVHWPEVMMTFDLTTKTLFSADAFGSFGALDGRIFNDELEYKSSAVMDEFRRYYSNIVGKYGLQVQAVFKKAPAEISMVCPLHGPIWRTDLPFILEKYQAWSTYQPEEKGVFIAFASMYGDTELAAQTLATKLAEKGVKNLKLVDVSGTHFSHQISMIFKYSHLVFATPTYNTAYHPYMMTLFNEMRELTVRNRSYALIENGSWAITAGKCMKAELDAMKNMTQIGETLTIKSAAEWSQEEEIAKLADLIKEDLEK